MLQTPSDVIMQCNFLLSFSLLTSYFNSVHNLVISKGFDAFLYQPIVANVTCGTPPEQYYNTHEGYAAPRSRILSLCDASNPMLRRPPSYMTDGNMSTSWQSSNDKDKAFITVTLDQVKRRLCKSICEKLCGYR